MVTDARSSVGLPHEGQNFFDASLQILHRNELGKRNGEMADALETRMTPQHPCLHFLDPLSFHTNKAQVHLK